MIIVAMILLTLVLMASVFYKVNVPVIILSLMIGLIFGSDVTGIIYLDNALLVKEIANAALMFILFIGGFGTKQQHFRLVLTPVLIMSTLGIMLTAVITGYLFHLITGWSFMNSLLVASIISSTDAAAVFSIFKGHPIEAGSRRWPNWSLCQTIRWRLFLLCLLSSDGGSADQHPCVNSEFQLATCGWSRYWIINRSTGSPYLP